MLTIDNITKSFNGTTAVSSFTTTIDKGEVVGLLGPNGAGKTTTMRMLATLLHPDKGTIKLNGINIVDDPNYMKRRLGYMPESNPLYDTMLVYEYLHFIGLAHEIPKSKIAKATREVVESVGLQDVYYKPIGECSKGYRQRVGLAAALIHKPDILILDEPTEGLDPNQRLAIRELVKNIGEKRTVLLSTHVMQEVENTCDRVIIMNKGEIIMDSPMSELSSHQNSKTVELGLVGSGDFHGQLSKIDWIQHVTRLSHNGDKRLYEIRTELLDDISAKIFNLAKDNNWEIYKLSERTNNLEELFRSLTAEGK